MSAARILVAGIGNVFLGDDGFGVEVARRLMERSWPEDVQVGDFGIRGFDLAFAMLDGYDVTIMVDALPRGGEPGTLYVLEPDIDLRAQPAGQAPEPAAAGQVAIDTHGMDPVRVLGLVTMFGGLPQGRVLVVGCEPGSFGPEGEGQMGLSEPVQAALDGALELVESLVMQNRS